MKALRIVLVAFAASALLIVLQTVIFQLLPWDSSASNKVAVIVRASFWFSDITMVVGLVSLARAEPKLRGLLAVGAILSTFAVLSGMVGLAANALGSDNHGLRQMGRVMGGAEPIVSIGTSLLVTLALGAMAKPLGSKVMGRANVVTIVVTISVVLSLGFKLVRLLDRGARSLPAAWTSWVVEVTRPALVALLALAVLRAMRSTTTETARPDGPYRAAGEGAPAVVAKEPLDPSSIAALRKVAGGLALYRTVFLVRVLGSVVISFFVFLIGITIRSDGALTFMAVMPLASLVTAVLLAIALLKMLALPQGVRARGVLVAAIVMLGFVALIDAGTLLFAFNAEFGPSHYGARREFTEVIFLAWPLVVLLGGASMLFVASALRRLGERLADDRVVGRASWVQGFAIGTGAALLGAMLAALVMNASRYEADSSAGGLVVALLCLAGFGATVALVILHVLLVGAARKAVLAAVDV